MSFSPKDFVVPKAKPLPVCLILDVSSSMAGDKIDSLNQAVEKMISTFASAEKMETEILVSVISFGAQVDLVHSMTQASDLEWQDLQAMGMTPMGTALKMAKAMIEDKETTPSRAYRPTIILISDGKPTDSWEKPMADFIEHGRSSKCDRMAMAIGHDADESVLGQFIKDTPHELFQAGNAAKLYEFFKMVTMSVTTRSSSSDPNTVRSSTESIDDSESKPDTDPEHNESYW